MPDPAPSPSPAIDRENPWPGLASFTEDGREFFFGREKETDELVRLIRRNTLTVLFGQSGLGKSSLLQAGVFPLLREADFLPLYLRLDHDPSTPPLADQVKAALVEAFKAAGADAPVPRADESLWEYFHRKDIDIWSAKNRLLTPVLAFDQFEEIFTLGRADDARRERGRAFLTELADLVENRPPAPLRAKFDSGELDTARYNFDKPSCQVILSLREDFLPDLEGLKNEMRSLMHNRMRVRRLTGTQALEIVTRPAPHLLADGVAERVVEFVAGARGGSAERLAEMEVEPSLLSVICRELNQRRRTLRQEQITADLVSGNRREILNDFYERSVADLPPAMREYVEDHLLTKSGFRDNVALETVLEAPGVTRPLVDTLVSRRLLRIEDRLGVQRVELTHDVLADVISASRDSRQQRLALELAKARERRIRRRVWWLRGVAAGLVLVLAAVSTLAWRAVKARDRETIRAARSDLEFAAQLLERGNAPAAIARLVRAAQTDPENPVAGSRLISALARQSWPIWQDTGIKLPSPGRYLSVFPDGKLVLVAGEDNVFRLLDARTFQVVREIHFPSPVTNGAFARNNSATFAVAFADGGVAAVDVATGEYHVMANPEGKGNWWRIALSPNGKWLALATNKKISVWDVAQGRVSAQTVFTDPQNPSALNFSPDSTKLVVSDWNYGVEILRVPTGEVLLPWFHPSEFNIGGASYADFSPDGATCVICWWQGARLFNAVTGDRIGPLLAHDAQSVFARFDEKGRRLVTVADDRTVRTWDTATQKEILPPLRHGAAVKRSQLSRDGRTLLVRSNDDFVHLWDATTGLQLVEPTLSVPTDGSVALDPSGGRVLFCAPDGRLMALSTAPSAIHPVAWMPQGESYKSVGGSSINLITYFSPDGKRVLLHWDDSGIQTFSLDTFGVAAERISYPPGAYGEDYDAKSGTLLARSPGNRWSLWHVSGGIPTKTLDLAGTPDDAPYGEFVGDGGLILIATVKGSAAGSIRLWRADDGLPAGPLLSLPVGVQADSIAVSPDHTRITLGSSNGVVGVWDIATGRQMVHFKTDSAATFHLALFSPDGKVIATGTYTDGTSADNQRAEARLWDAETGEPRSPVFAHRENIVGVSFSSDSRLAALASGDGTVDVVSTATGLPVGSTLVHPDALPTGRSDPHYGPVRFRGPSSIVSMTAKMVSWWDARSGLPAMEPLRASHEPIADFEIGPTGKDMIVIGRSGRVEIWPVPPQYEKKAVPAWLLRLATSLAGVRLDETGALVPVVGGFSHAQEELAAVRQELSTLPADAPYTEWGRWILADPDKRPIAPGLNITYAEAKARGLAD